MRTKKNTTPPPARYIADGAEIYESEKFPGVPLIRPLPASALMKAWDQMGKTSLVSLPPIDLIWGEETATRTMALLAATAPFVAVRVLNDGRIVYEGPLLRLILNDGWSWCYNKHVGMVTMGIRVKWRDFIDLPKVYEEQGKQVEKQEEESKIRVHAEVRGPHAADVHVLQGDLTSNVLFELTCGEHIYQFVAQADPAGRPIDVPHAARHLYLRQYMNQSYKAPDLKSSKYYQTALNAYSAWSYDIHLAQVQDVLANVPLGWTIVAPGDGIGVVSRAWSGPVIAGDLAKTDLSHTAVTQESLERTIQRGVCAPTKNKVFIMSYVWDWLQFPSLRQMVETGCPMVFLQATDNFPLIIANADVVQIGPGAFACNLPVTWRLHVHRAERYRPSPNILFSENLLRHEGFKFFGSSDYVTYFRTMKPKSMATPASLTLVSSLKDLVSLHRETPQLEIYFAPIGRKFRGVWEWPTTYESTNITLPLRQIIAVSTTSLHKYYFVKANFPFYEYEGLLYFYVSLEPKGTVMLQYNTSTVSVKSSVTFVEYPDQSVRWGVKGDKFYVYSVVESHTYCVCHFKSPKDMFYVAFIWRDWIFQHLEFSQFLRDLRAFVMIDADFQWDPAKIIKYTPNEWQKSFVGHTMLIATRGPPRTFTRMGGAMKVESCEGCCVCTKAYTPPIFSCCSHKNRVEVVHRRMGTSMSIADIGQEKTTVIDDETITTFDTLARGATQYEWLPADDLEGKWELKPELVEDRMQIGMKIRATMGPDFSWEPPKTT